MNVAIKKGSMQEAVNSIYQILIKDETLLRLLYYPPYDGKVNKYEPLSDELDNILEMSVDKTWEIIGDRIKLSEKVSDLETRELCRINISLGRRRPVFKNYIQVTQEIMLSVYIHENYDDMRLQSISDRINELIALERLNGMIGLLDYVAGNPRVAPRQYQRFDHVYEYTDSKK